ncbi:MAG: hypothetical protein J2P48_18635 [Alphaproteobacteria bacterium]|nr:hypothetical protein [Alphaproteobacteria bacterium]
MNYPITLTVDEDIYLDTILNNVLLGVYDANDDTRRHARTIRDKLLEARNGAITAATRAVARNDWELYADHPDYKEAILALERGWSHAKTLPDMHAALDHMNPILEKFIEVGAMDSEPLRELDRRLNETFGTGR